MVPNRDAVSRACPNDGLGRAARRTIRQQRTTGLRVINPNLLELSSTARVVKRGIAIALRGLCSSYSPVPRVESSFKKGDSARMEREQRRVASILYVDFLQTAVVLRSPARIGSP